MLSSMLAGWFLIGLLRRDEITCKYILRKCFAHLVCFMLFRLLHVPLPGSSLTSSWSFHHIIPSSAFSVPIPVIMFGYISVALYITYGVD